jgi:hypothetical protein
MKARNLIRLSLCLITALLISTAPVFSQDDIKPTRKEIKEAKKLQMVANYAVIDSLLTRRVFVLEADYLRNKYGEMVSVMSNVNFIRVNQTTGVLQTGSVFSFGSNGVGGVTAEGEIGTWELNKNPKNLTYTVRFSLQTNIGHYDVLLNVSANTRATATITGLGPGNLTWEGHLVPIGNARIFKGQNSI